MSKKQKLLSHPKYRTDIDGLRAIAVLSVISFHAFPNWIKGGFIGVDIFFVISGYLISTIIFSNLENNCFNFIEFYNRRIKRIFPALILILFFCLTMGWFTLFADEYKQLGKHTLGGTSFASNFIFWKESGYFDNTAESKPLLHLWSLGIEEQFYIIWPLLLWFAWKTKFNLLIITLSTLIISFGLNIDEIHNNKVAAFYLPQARFWELLVGATLSHFTLYKKNIFIALPNIFYSIISITGLTFILIALLIITKDKPFPGWWAILPTIGAMLIISSGTEAWFNRVILSNPILVWIGLISFPLYLWHWPLLSFTHILENEASINIRIFAIALSFVLAWLTYQFIEKPIRFQNKNQKTTYALLSLMTLLGFAAFSIYKNEGFQGYGPRTKEKSDFADYFENSLPKWNYFENNSIPQKYRFDCDFYNIANYRIGKSTTLPLAKISNSCYIPSQDPKKKNILLIWGDSHAQQLYFGLNNQLPKDWQILIISSSGCPANIDAPDKNANDYCQRSNQLAIKTISEIKPTVVLVAQNDHHIPETLNKLSDFLLHKNVNKVIFTGPTPHWNNELPKIILRKLWSNTPERTFEDINKKIINENEIIKSQLHVSNTIIFIDLIDFFCNESGCLTRIGDDKKRV
jgi:peptidoglycan/LPS O-acetylase OafA/YrhL